MARTASSLEDRARRHVTRNCPYAFYFKDVAFHAFDGELLLTGRVPTFHLKQILQTLLADLEGVDGIDNRVDVVSSTGVSS